MMRVEQRTVLPVGSKAISTINQTGDCGKYIIASNKNSGFLKNSVFTNKFITTWLMVITLILVIVPVASSQVSKAPSDVLRQQEGKHKDSRGVVYLGKVMTLTYPAYTLDANETYYPHLMALAGALNTPVRKNYRVVLKGYTDNSGSPDDNLRISLKRAEHLKELLVRNPTMALKEERITIEGHGASNPVASNNTFKGREQNRRVEIHIYGDVSAAVGSIARRDQEPLGAELDQLEGKPSTWAHQSEHDQQERQAPSEELPLDVLKQLEREHRDSKGVVYLGKVITLIYPAYALEADKKYHPLLMELTGVLKSSPRETYRLVLKGYTDNSGSPDDNLRISLKRAEHLKELLVRNPTMALKEERITVEGHGVSNPVASNNTFKGRAQNRRVEIHIYGDVSAAAHLVKGQEKATPRQDPEIGEGKTSPPFEQAISSAESVAQVQSQIPPAVETVPLSLLDAIHYSLQGNRDIQVVSYVPEQAQENLVDAESVYDPSLFLDGTYTRSPNLESSVADIVMENDGLLQSGIRKPLKTGGSLSAFLETGYNDLDNALFERTFKYSFAPTIELSQPLLKNLGSKEEKAAIKIANYQVKISAEDFRQTVIDIATRVSTAYWQLYLFQELVKINQQNLDMAEEVYRRETVRHAESISKTLDVERARSNAEARRATLLRSRERFRVVMDRLKLLLNWSNLTINSEAEVVPIEVPQTVIIDVDEGEAIEKAFRHRPEIEKAKQALAIRRVEEDLSAHKRLPKLDFFARYSLSGYGKEFSSSVDDTTLNDDDAWAVGLKFEWPLGNRSANARYRKKSLERQQATAEIDRVKDQIALDVKEALLAIDLARGEIESTRLAKEAAEQVVEGELVRFDLAQMSNEELLRAQDLLAVTSRNYVRAIIDYNIAMAELARAQGIPPHGVTIENNRW